jgi:hypothetical protein
MNNAKFIDDSVFILAKTLLELRVGNAKPTLKDIENILTKVNELQSLKPEEIVALQKKLEANIAVDMGLGSFITDNTHTHWFNDFKSNNQLYYWHRYHLLLKEKGFSKKVIMKMDEVSDTIVDLLGNPNSENLFKRKGLVVGDVQSGKTANYISAITKAADAGYKVIILLAGTLNSLRSQTQERIDEGFIGIDSSMFLEKKKHYVGVGKIDAKRRPLSVTTLDSDFNTRIAKVLQVQLNDYNEPAIFVIKKNSSVLKNLIKWVQSTTEELDRAELPLLIIDDEADYASVNTKKDDEDPTKINEGIREIFSIFPKVTYVGFTATPFANVFINPDSPEEMANDDLFPSNFIYVLDSPNNYFGPNRIFGEKLNTLVLNEISDMEEFLPFKHKKDHEIFMLPPSLKRAILSFFIVNTMRDIRGDIYHHRTMLVNTSRFTKVQNSLTDVIKEAIYDWKYMLKHFEYDKQDDNEVAQLYREILDVYRTDYGHIEDYNEQLLLQEIRKSAQKIIATSVNMTNKAADVINYKQYNSVGLRVIAVGGQTLSRGLTLEGLSISYFYRNSRYYDTLMQMGRWFGYRPGYEDLCKIYMSDVAMNWYSHIQEATEELKEEIKMMMALNKTPVEFGLKVMSHPTTLLITAPNKLRSSANYSKSVSLSETIIETPRIINSKIVNDSNINELQTFTKLLCEKYKIENHKGYPIFYDIEKEDIINYLINYQTHISNVHFNTRELSQYIKNNKQKLDKWDVVFIQGSSNEVQTICSINVKPSKRQFIIKEGRIIQLSGNKNRLGTPTATQAGLTEEQIKQVKEENSNDNKGLSAKLYVTNFPDRKPLMMIYLVELSNDKKSYYDELKIKDRIVLGLGLAFPKLDDYSDKNFIVYKLNKVYYEQMFLDLDYGDEEDGD